MIELLIFDFSSNFTGQDLQKFSFVELSQRMIVITYSFDITPPSISQTTCGYAIVV